MQIYTIDKEKSVAFRTLTISIGSTQSEQDLLNMAEEKERILIKSLIDEEKAYRLRENKRTPAPFPYFRISPAKSLQLLQMMASLGKVYYATKQLACDFFSRLQLAYVVDELPDGQITVSSLVKDKNTEWPLDSVDLICVGAPYIIIRGNFLRFMQEGTSLKSVEPHCMYTKKEYQAWHKEVLDDDCPPEISFKSKPAEISVKADPLPILFLCDHSGAFANLMLDYEGQYLPFKGTKAELALEKDLLESGFQKKLMANSHYYCPVDRASGSIDFLLDIGWRALDYKKREITRLSELHYELKEDADVYIIQGKISFGTECVEVEALFEALEKKSNYIELKNNKVGLLFKKDVRLAPLMDMASEIEIVSGRATIKKNRLGLIESLEKEVTLKKIAECTVPAAFQGTLREYQQHGVSWLKFLYQNQFGAILADDMGLGKTVQVIAFLATLPAHARSLIVVPTSLLFNWRREIEHFYPQATVYVHHGQVRNLNNQEAQIILTSYGVLRQEIASLEQIPFSAVFLDEAASIKNSDTKTAQAVLRIRANFRLSITGTPIENSLNELFSQFQFLIPDLLDPEDLLPDNLARLKKKIRPFILRRKKQDVAKDLPEKIEQTIFVEMQEAQKVIYERTLASFKQGLLKKIALDGSNKHTMEILEVILRLRQISCHPQLVPQLILENEDTSSAKFEQVLEDLTTLYAEGKKVVIFSQFTKMLGLLAQEAKRRHWNFATLDGATKDREEAVNSFQNDSNTLLFFVSLKAGGVGLNLTKADYVLIYDPWWNEAAEKQAADRAHRIGRKDVVIVKRYVSQNSIEESILELQTSKRQIADSIFEEASFIASLTIDELTNLLG